MAEMHLKKTAVVGGRVAKEMVKFPLTANVAIGRAAQIVTTALTPSARTLADSLRSVGTKISGAVQRGFIASGVSESSPKAARVLEVAGKTLSFSVQTAFSMVAGSLNLAAMIIQSPRQALSQGIAGITGAYTRTATAVKGSIAKLAAAGGGGPLGFAKAATMGVAKGAFSLAAKPVKAVGSVIASQVQQSRPYMAMMGGPIVKADDGTASKKGGFFTASKTYDAQGAVTSKSGGFAKNMAAVPFNAIAGGMKMIGGATSMAMGSVSSLANMMLYKLGPAGFLLMPILGKVTAGLQAMGAKALLIVLPLLTIFAVFKIVKKGWDSFSKYTDKAGENFKKVKKIFEEIINSIKEIFFDFFATLTGGGKDSSAATPAFGDTTQIAGMKKMGASIEEFSKKALAFAKQFKIIFDKYIAPFIYQVLAGFALILKGVINVFMGIFNVVKGIYQKIKGEGDNGTGALKAGWDKLKDGIGTVLKGIIKMFLPVLTLLINVVFKFVELVVQLFEFLGFAVVNIIRYMVKTIISIATGIVSIFAFVIDKVIEAFVFLQTNLIKIYRFILEVGVNVGKGILKGFIWAIQKILDAFGGLLVGVGNILGFVPQLIGAVFQSLADKAKEIPLIGGLLAKPAEAIAKGFDFIATGFDVVTDKAKSSLEGVLDPLSKGIDAGANAIITVLDGVASKAISVVEAIGEVGNTMREKIASGGNAARRAVDGLADGANRLIGSASDGVNSLREGIVNWLDSFAGGDDIMKGLGKGAKDAIDEAIKNTDPSALAAAGEDIAKAIKEGLKNVKMNFFEKVIDNLGKALEKQKTKLADALNLQKDNQLKIFDDQIAAIDALAAAEEKLTATIEFENKKREAEAERALQRKNYEKQRALAIYEGRIDDARTLDQEETKNRKDAEKNLQDMQTDRNKTLQGEQRDTAKTIIGQQKTKAAEAFDKDIKAFEEFAANVLSKGTFTQAELESQFAEISNKASEMSLDMRDSFATFYTALPGLISANTEPTVGFFNTGLQTLVDAAKAKFGLDAEVNADSILGSTALMLNGSTAMFAEKMPLVLEEYKKGTDALAQVGIDWATPGNPNSPESIYGKAIADANAAMLREFMKMKTEAGSAFAEVVKEINAQIKDIAIADAIKAATEGLKKVGTGSDTGAGTETPVSTIGSALDNTTYSYPKTAAELGLNPTQTTLYNDAMSGVALGSGGNNPFGTVSAAYMDQFNIASPGSPAKNKSLAAFKDQIKPKKFFELNDTGPLITTIKQALRFYGYDTGNTDPKLGQAAVAAVAQFQEKYAISPTDGRVRENTARALGLFSDPGTPKRYYGGAIKRMMGGPVGAYGAGGTVPGFAMKAVPALLHGGEYVVNAKAVQNLGSGFLQYINNLKNGMPRFGIPKPNMPNVNINQTVNVNGGNSENINNYNFYVDNFIGEDKWFEGMMNEYNVKVVPNKQKSAGLESRVIRSYNGINKGI
jgi:peptidoglycan hydrolase-like protein with peptidoglycan-binding domain/predicted dinucleotide-utilizing enzyme